MKKVLVIPNRERITEYQNLANQYGLGFEFNDFFMPALLDDEEKLSEAIKVYTQLNLPEYTTMHGAFFDVTPCSIDEKIRQISRDRIGKSLDVARKLKVKAVVFHTGYNPFLNIKEFVESWLLSNIAFWDGILAENPDINIYLENMFETMPDLLERLAEGLAKHDNFGICLDYSHAVLYGQNPGHWAMRLGKYIKHIHINDNDGSSDQHLAWGDGITNRKQFYEDYATYMPNATVLIETSKYENAVKSLQMLEKENFL